MPTCTFGIDQLIRDPGKFLNRRIALVTNQAATTSTGVPTRKALLDAGLPVHRIFSPEHGLLAQGADGAYQADGTDALTGLPVISLYGEQMAPSAEHLDAIDLVIFDIPDVGCRFYTYLWTLTHVMESCDKLHVPLLLTDRPNPASGDLSLAEGPWLDEARCSSFIGRWNIPVRHSCTLGELAQYFQAGRLPGLSLEIIPVNNWNRFLTAKESGWYFAPTSPAIRNPAISLLYPGTGLLEGIQVNEGRGTPAPFSLFGAPWIRGEDLYAAFIESRLTGVEAMPIVFTPDASLYADTRCEGLHLTVTDPRIFRPVRTGLTLISLLLRLYPEKCAERLYPTLANPTGERHLDKLTGLYHCFDKLQEGIIPDTEVPEWKERIEPFLLY